MKKDVKENKLHPSKGKLFLRIQRECWRRMATPWLMYLFMSFLMLASQAIGAVWARILLGSLCLLGGMAFNAHLCYNYGVAHFDCYLTGCIHRKNEAYGIESGGDHRIEREYRVWKGFYIGFLVGLPSVLFGILAGCLLNAGSSAGEITGSISAIFLIMFSSWSIVPISWLRNYPAGNPLLPDLNFAWSIIMIVIPIVVSGVFYIVGAMAEKRKKAAQAARTAAVEQLQREAQASREKREQTEEQRKKTMQSKKKK